MKDPAAPCPARYKHAACGAVVKTATARHAGLLNDLGRIVRAQQGAAPAYVRGPISRPCARLRPLTYATARLRYEATLHGEP